MLTGIEIIAGLGIVLVVSLLVSGVEGLFLRN
jgi:hypothetical protein